jgi:hypothetical protein
MKRFFICALISITAASSAMADVAVSIAVGEPGFYGQIDIGNYPPPRLVYTEPVIVEPVVVVSPPIYLHVRHDHIVNWDSHCHEYGACAQRVYFVDNDWYDTVYVTEYHKKHGKKGKGKNH